MVTMYCVHFVFSYPSVIWLPSIRDSNNFQTFSGFEEWHARLACRNENQSLTTTCCPSYSSCKCSFKLNCFMFVHFWTMPNSSNSLKKVFAHFQLVFELIFLNPDLCPDFKWSKQDGCQKYLTSLDRFIKKGPKFFFYSFQNGLD
jgi:hypothetical protein